MKKSLLVLSALAMIVALIAAAPASAAGGKGLKAGMTMFKFTGDDAGVLDMGYRNGFAFGAYMDHALSPSMYLHTEALYAMKGAEYNDGGDSFKVKLNYLQIPVLLKMQGKGSSLFFCAGPDIGIKSSAKAEVSSGGISAEDTIDDVKSLDLGLTFGAGIEMTKFSLEARYTMGLSSWDDSADSVDLKNSGFMFLVGMGL